MKRVRDTFTAGICGLCLFLLLCSAWTPGTTAASSFIHTDYRAITSCWMVWS